GHTSDKDTKTQPDKTQPQAPTAADITTESPSVQGKTEPGPTITVNIPGHESITGIVHDKGNYVIELPMVLNGGEEVPIIATDKVGKVSSETKKTVTDITAPVKPSVNGVRSIDKEATGQAQPGSEVTVHFPDGTTSKATADRDGNYSVEVPDS
ncbi:YSIRK signal domain/LPXTG anchor domain surface protein, partial [Staphylococcus pettenkoferi]|uniref:Ig-like domain-containing protein n=1 Tax=Staphylococcus pettenkoferi TaxID=170573 RepID=UPI000FF1584A